MIKVPSSGNVKLGSLRVTFTGGRKGLIVFDVIDNSFFRYESGYYKEYRRKVTKKGTIRFAGYTLDLNDIIGIQNIIG